MRARPLRTSPGLQIGAAGSNAPLPSYVRADAGPPRVPAIAAVTSLALDQMMDSVDSRDARQ